ncbi:MAG: hypothetical protein AB7K24_27375 [Gemmataceae bacterium]
MNSQIATVVEMIPPVREQAAAALELADQLVRAVGGRLRDIARRARRHASGEAGALLLLTGNRGRVGTSTLALALAQAAAAEMSVLLIDADLGGAGLSQKLCGRVTLGWEEALRGRCSFAQPLRYADPQRLVALLPLKQPVDDPNDLLAKPALRVWMSQHRNDFDLVILDGGSLFGTGARWAAWCDASILVCDARHTPDHAPCWDLLEEEGCQVLGIIETFSDEA